MKRILLACSFLLVSVTASASVLTFDDLAGCCSAVPYGYGGFDWSSGTTIGHLAPAGVFQGSPYDHGIVSGNSIAYNWFGNSNSVIRTTDSSTFTFNGAFFSSAAGIQQLSFQGFNNGSLIYESIDYNVSTLGILWIGLDWTGIDSLTINNSGEQWIMDNFTYNESVAVPEPASLLLLGLGLCVLGWCLRRGFKK